MRKVLSFKEPLNLILGEYSKNPNWSFTGKAVDGEHMILLQKIENWQFPWWGCQITCKTNLKMYCLDQKQLTNEMLDSDLIQSIFKKSMS